MFLRFFLVSLALLQVLALRVDVLESSDANPFTSMAQKARQAAQQASQKFAAAEAAARQLAQQASQKLAAAEAAAKQAAQEVAQRAARKMADELAAAEATSKQLAEQASQKLADAKEQVSTATSQSARAASKAAAAVSQQLVNKTKTLATHVVDLSTKLVQKICAPDFTVPPPSLTGIFGLPFKLILFPFQRISGFVSTLTLEISCCVSFFLSLVPDNDDDDMDSGPDEDLLLMQFHRAIKQSKTKTKAKAKAGDSCVSHPVSTSSVYMHRRQNEIPPARINCRQQNN